VAAGNRLKRKSPVGQLFTTRPELQGGFGMVASTHWLASAAGMAVLEKGGNAFDAAVAAGFVLQVVEPHLNGPGGDMPAIVYDARSGETRVICGQGTAPAGLTIAHIESLGLDMIPGDGHLAPCVPGAFGAWLLLLSQFGTLRLRDVLEYAIGYAERGYPVLPTVANRVASVEALFKSHWPSSAKLYFERGAPVAGRLFRNPDLAATYIRILEEAESGGGSRVAEIEAARRAFYEGFVAEAIDSFVRHESVMDVSGAPHAGVLRGSDLVSWRASIEGTTSFKYRNFEVHKAGAWSQGPAFLQQLALLAEVEVGELDFLSAEHIHLVIEGAKLAFADREAWYGDVADVPIDALLSKDYTGERRSLVTDEASDALRPGAPAGRLPRLPRFARGQASDEHSMRIGEPTVAAEERGDTCHVDVVDRYGNLVSATPSGGWLHSNPVVPGLGFPLGTRAQMFNLEAGLPNALEPGKRPRTTLSPSFAFRDGEPYLAFGTPGGDAQDQWTFNFFVAHADFGLSLQEAIDAPNFSIQHFPDSFYPHLGLPAQVTIEDRVEPAVIEDLRARRHRVVLGGPWTEGRVSAVARDARRNLLLAGANPRGMQGYAAGR
jgi:gamma-glutamyltranspeptidase / glutathione hydrolase